MKGLKTGGRVEGVSKNKLTKTAKEILGEIIEEELARLPGLLEQLTPNERAQLLTKLLPYRISKETTDVVSKPQPIIYIHKDL
jgi:hypothetical protein